MKVFTAISTIAILVCSSIICNSLIIAFNSKTNNNGYCNGGWKCFPEILHKFILSYSTIIPYYSNSNKIQNKQQQQQQQQQSPSEKILEWRRRLQENNNELPHLLWVHVGKCGGITLEKFLPINVFDKKKALPCIMNETTITNNDNNTNLDDAISKCIPSTISINNNSINIPILSQYIFSHLHLIYPLFQRKNEKQFVFNNINGYIFIVRNPITRIISAFNYHYYHFLRQDGNKARKDFLPRERDKAHYYVDCFHSVNDLALAMRDDLDDDESNSQEWTKSCISVGKRVLQGQVGGLEFSHFHAGYQFYEKKTLLRTTGNNTATKKDSNVSNTIQSSQTLPSFVIRTEHIWDDAARLDIMLGGNGNFTNYGKSYTHGSEKYKVNGTIETIYGKQAICCMIYLDILSYHRIITYAMNLNDNEKTDAIIQSMKECGVNTSKSALLLINNTNVLHYYGTIWESWYNETCNGTPPITPAAGG